MILLLGGSGYVGTAFRNFLETHNITYRSISRRDTDYYNKVNLQRILEELKPQIVINAAGYTGKPNVDACEIHKSDCIQGNVLLPSLLAEACTKLNIVLGHVSSGCIYTGNTPNGRGFTESCTPNFCFRTNNCSFYSGCKALGEECLANCPRAYIWRLRIPFNNVDSPRNYLSKILTYNRLLNARNSVSHLNEFVRACVQSYQLQIPFGTYNITNPGSVTTEEVVHLVSKILKPNKTFIFFKDEMEFMSTAATTPRSNCVLDSSKIQGFGIKLTDTLSIVEECLLNWKQP